MSDGFAPSKEIETFHRRNAEGHAGLLYNLVWVFRRKKNVIHGQQCILLILIRISFHEKDHNQKYRILAQNIGICIACKTNDWLFLKYTAK